MKEPSKSESEHKVTASKVEQTEKKQEVHDESNTNKVARKEKLETKNDLDLGKSPKRIKLDDNTSNKETSNLSALAVVQEQKLLEPLSNSKSNEPMYVDSNENSSDANMEVDIDEKIEMDVDNGNGNIGGPIVYNDEEMKSIEKKVVTDTEMQGINNNELPSATNVIEIQRKVVSPYNDNVIPKSSSPTKKIIYWK